jgi:hypothetical protein
VQDPVDVPISGSRESVVLVVVARDVDRCGAVPASESTAVGKSTDVRDVAEDPGWA